MTVKVAVIHHSATGIVHAPAQSVGEGGVSAGPEVRPAAGRRDGARQRDRPEPLWRQRVDATVAAARAPVEDLAWADAFAFGTPTRFGAPAAQPEQFVDQVGRSWWGQAGRQAGDRCVYRRRTGYRGTGGRPVPGRRLAETTTRLPAASRVSGGTRSTS